MCGKRVSFRAEVVLAKAPIGATIRDEDGWRPLDEAAAFEIDRDSRARVWACLPEPITGQEWTVFEGPRAVVPYNLQGVRLEAKLFGWGEPLCEPLCIEPRRFNLNGSGVPLAANVVNTGIVTGCEPVGETIRLRTSTAIGWTKKHTAFAWHEGGMTELAATDTRSGGNELAFAMPDCPFDGVCLFYGMSWLGTAFFAKDAEAAASAFLDTAEAWPTRLEQAVLARLPLLARIARKAIDLRLLTEAGKVLVALCRLPTEACFAHLTGRLLEAWEPKPKLAEAIVARFLAASEIPAQPTVLERLVSDAPCVATRVLALGVQPLSQKQRIQIVAALLARVVPHDLNIPRTASNGRIDPSVDDALLNIAVSTARLDRNFLIAKSAGIAALAWESVSDPASPLPQNLATSLTIAPVRRWLAMHLLARLAREFC
jgi:hypothetical protein